MDLNKIPRWALILIATVGLGAISLVAADAKTKVETAVKNSWSAKSMSESNGKDIEDVKIQVAEVRGAQEQFRREYREDQKELDRRLGELLVAVRK